MSPLNFIYQEYSDIWRPSNRNKTYVKTSHHTERNLQLHSSVTLVLYASTGGKCVIRSEYFMHRFNNLLFRPAIL